MVAVIAVVALAVMPVTSRQGVDFVVTTHELPLYVKGVDFLDRDLNYRVLAREITRGKTTDELRVLAVFEWTRANIHDVPPRLSIIDDHVWHIIVRGYGAPDQKADVFTTLVTYGGVPAYWIILEQEGRKLPISFAKIDGRWSVFDVQNGIVYRDRRGRLAAVEEIAAEPALVREAAGTRMYNGLLYVRYFADFRAPTPPHILRAEMQMVGTRMWFEAKRLLGLGGGEWNPVPRPKDAR